MSATKIKIEFENGMDPESRSVLVEAMTRLVQIQHKLVLKDGREVTASMDGKKFTIEATGYGDPDKDTA